MRACRRRVGDLEWIIVRYRCRVLVQHREKNSNTLHARIHSLPIKGNHGTSSVSNYDPRTSKMVWLALDADQGKVRIRLEGLNESLGGNQFCYPREMLIEERGDGSGIILQTSIASAGEEESASERAIL